METCRPGICTKCAQPKQRRFRTLRPLSDSDIFDLLVQRHHQAVATYALALARDQWQAEEAVQDTFFRAWNYLDSFRGDGCFEGWLLRICRNCIVTNSKKTRRSTQEIVERLVVAADSRTEIMLMVGCLPILQREALTLCRLLGYSYEAAATILDVPVGTIRSRVSRGRATLELMLAEVNTA